MSKLKQLVEKAKGLEAKDPRKAAEVWVEVLETQESEGDANADLSIYNRIGDLYIKLKDPAQAADYYDRAVDKYAELGFHNNAIAMCNKVLRNAPARQTTYLKLAKLYASKGFIAEAKQNFVEYAERMQKAGKIDHAFSALKEFTDISPESANLREMLTEQLKMYGGDPGKRMSSAKVAPPPPKPSGEEREDLSKSGTRKTSSLVFLDLDAPRGAKTATPAAKTVASPAAAPPPAPAPAPPAPEPPPPAAEKLIQEVVPEPDESLEIETTSLVEEAADASPGGGAGSGMLEGLETTNADFSQVAATTSKPPSIRDEVTTSDLEMLEPLPELEPTTPEPPAVPPEEVIALDDADLVFEGAVTEPKKPAGKKPPAFKKPPPAPPPESPRVKPVVPKRPPPSAPAPEPEAGLGKRKTVVEVPPLELEPDFQSATTNVEHDVDDEPLAIDEPRSGFIDLGIDEIGGGDDQAGSLVFSNIEQTPAAPDIEELESRVADNPDDPEAHQALGEALVEQGERERGIEELDLATAGFENKGQLDQARDLVDEVLRLDPNSVRHRQKAVEFAFKAGDKPRLVAAYLELADALLRSDLPDKARAVYARVAEHDPKNERAKGALSMLAPAVAPPPAAKPEGKVKAKDAKMKVRDETALDGDFIDLGSMLTEDDEDTPQKDTRLRVEDEEPTGDEEQDFQDMLARFKQGIDENIDETDFQSHYDLGVAFKEMGLLDEAIAELQKALRAPEGKLRTSEMLGICFFEKGAYGVAESILRRGLDLPASGDQERLGVLYWLGRALEQQGKKADARELYGRVFAVDIRFLDAEQRVKALAKAK